MGHVFRKISPYSWPGGVANILNHNTQRIASVWMDEYQDIFYKMNPRKCLIILLVSVGEDNSMRICGYYLCLAQLYAIDCR